MTEEEFDARRTLIALLPEGQVRIQEHVALLEEALPFFFSKVVEEALPYAPQNSFDPYASFFQRLIAHARHTDPNVTVRLVEQSVNPDFLYDHWQSLWDSGDDALPFTIRLCVFSRMSYQEFKQPVLREASARVLTELESGTPYDPFYSYQALCLTTFQRHRPAVRARLPELWANFLSFGTYEQFRPLTLSNRETDVIPTSSMMRKIRRLRRTLAVPAWESEVAAWLFQCHWTLLWVDQVRRLHPRAALHPHRPLPRWLDGRLTRLRRLHDQAPNERAQQIAAKSLIGIEAAVAKRKRIEAHNLNSAARRAERDAI